VIHSLHKTLPAFTQTALLHLAGDLVEEKRVEQYLSVFQTSSPSYLLMGSIDYCLRLIRCQGADLWTDILRSTGEFTRKMKELNCLHLVDSTDTACWNKDPLKLLVVVKDGTVNRKTGTEFTGHDLYHRLREEYHLQMEMEADTYVLGILTCMDTQEGLSRLAKSLREIDADCEGKTDRTSVNMSADKGIANLAGENRGSKSEDRLQVIDSIAVAMEKHKLLVDLEDAAGRECGCFLNLYPPGIPLIVPGEVISRDLVDKLIRYKRQGLTLQGLMAEKVTVVTD
jgi:arginine/lysine/ornithine decarboxylase